MDEPVWRTLSTGRCFVYLLPCREEDTLKIGFARDPWVRMRAFHPRFHAFFDLERGILVETDKVKEARSIETHLKSTLARSACVAPLAVRERAGGRFEWFRGADAQAVAEMEACSARLGYALHRPLSGWLRSHWVRHGDVIAEWSRQRFAEIEALHFNAATALDEPFARQLRNVLEAWDCIGVPLDDIVSDPILRWYHFGFDP